MTGIEDRLSMTPAVRREVETYIQQERLPAAYADSVEQWFLPLLAEIAERRRPGQPMLVGVSGSQGSGKSTLAGLLVRLAQAVLQLKAVSLSIDDFYLTRQERHQLAGEIHPLLATRGVPGTHDVNLARRTLAALGKTGEVSIPRFDKASDDRLDPADWPRVAGPVDLVVLEGWCLGIEAQPEQALTQPVNELERYEDPDAAWRAYVNERIHQDYRPLYALIDFLVMLKAPDFEQVQAWRQQQEDKLAEKLGAEGRDVASSRVMDPEAIRRFIQHYERLTRHGLETLPEQADVVFQLSPQQTIEGRT